MTQTLTHTDQLRRSDSFPVKAYQSLSFGEMLSASQAMREVFKQLMLIAPSDANVLINGETGTGKELAARGIHLYSNRANKPFRAVNCGAIPDSLIDSELFGHEKGAFTGASARRRGIFESAQGGTVFLDEITEMPKAMQSRLLRVLETQKVMPVGGEKEIPIDCRIIAATNRSPHKAISDDHLREDLYYRLAVCEVTLPPLRDRREDTAYLAEHFLQHTNRVMKQNKRFSAKGLKAIQEYHWPGNIRQLKHAVFRAWILADHETVDMEGLDPRSSNPFFLH